MSDNENLRLDRIETELETLNGKIDNLSKKVDTLTQEQSQAQKWQDRTWDVIKWVGGISAGLAISASIALFGLVIRFATNIN